MKRTIKTLLTISALLPLSFMAVDSGAQAPAPPQPTATVAPQPVAPADSTVNLSQPVREVVKLAAAGVPEDVIRAYIDNSSSTFNLSPDSIISLHGLGVSGTITAAILAHDRAILDKATANAPLPAMAQAQPQPQMQPQMQPQGQMPPAGMDQQPNSVQTTTIGYDPSSYYSSLSPYGNWNYFPDYGWYWQPYSWVNWSVYPWGYGYFGGGRWCYFRGRGWCWAPPLRGGIGIGFGGRVGIGFGRGGGFVGIGRGGFGGGFGGHRR